MPGPRPSKKKQNERALRAKTKQAEKIVKAADEQKVERRGGYRPNAGGKPGPRGIAKRLMGVREITMDIIKSGKVPLRVMINNMIFYDEKAVSLEEQFADALADNAKTFKPEQFLKAMEIFSQLSDARMKAQKCACDAAPFLHPRLSAVDMQITKREAPRDIKPDADVEKYREDFRQLRSAPFIIEQTEVDVDETEESE